MRLHCTNADSRGVHCIAETDSHVTCGILLPAHHDVSWYANCLTTKLHGTTGSSTNCRRHRGFSSRQSAPRDDPQQKEVLVMQLTRVHVAAGDAGYFLWHAFHQPGSGFIPVPEPEAAAILGMAQSTIAATAPTEQLAISIHSKGVLCPGS